jgi:Flp pilus assembly protein TadG|tara:strand:+ start:429 stop:962 length:534 start_codon:yes stop_codon:yes gene_type:complete
MFLIDKVKNWIKGHDGLAAMESAFIFPVMMTMLFGVVDVGTSVMVNTKVLSATQIASDLITRESVITEDDITEARRAAEAALIPYFDASDFGIDIAGILFVDEEATAEEQWRRTFNMSANTAAVSTANGLGIQGEGVVIVTVQYTYTPRFGEFVTGDIVMREVSFVKGRDEPYVDLQ